MLERRPSVDNKLKLINRSRLDFERFWFNLVRQIEEGLTHLIKSQIFLLLFVFDLERKQVSSHTIYDI